MPTALLHLGAHVKRWLWVTLAAAALVGAICFSAAGGETRPAAVPEREGDAPPRPQRVVEEAPASPRAAARGPLPSERSPPDGASEAGGGEELESPSERQGGPALAATGVTGPLNPASEGAVYNALTTVRPRIDECYAEWRASAVAVPTRVELVVVLHPGRSSDGQMATVQVAGGDEKAQLTMGTCVEEALRGYAFESPDREARITYPITFMP